jgi:chemotaxis protein CheD
MNKRRDAMMRVLWKEKVHSEVLYTQQHCLPEFSHINHYWDEQGQKVVAKILPGEFYRTSQNVVIATTLGSCISACIYDSVLGIGGMNHFMLPLTKKVLTKLAGVNVVKKAMRHDTAILPWYI